MIPPIGIHFLLIYIIDQEREWETESHPPTSKLPLPLSHMDSKMSDQQFNDKILMRDIDSLIISMILLSLYNSNSIHSDYIKEAIFMGY